MVARDVLLAEVEHRLGHRRLVWAGIRGDDIAPLGDLPQFHGSFVIAGAYANRGGVEALAYEDLTGVRVDPEVRNIEERLGAAETRVSPRSPAAVMAQSAAGALALLCGAGRVGPTIGLGTRLDIDG